jgi:glycosyltransferase involved in cell wall biosynthesis
MNDLVSIIIPCYNASSFLKDAVQSVLDQTYMHWELILINDHSTDDTANVIQECVQLNPEKIRDGMTSGKGACAARNTGLAMAKGKFIQFLDADDLIHTRKLEMQLSAFTENTDVVYSDLRVISYVDGKLLEQQHFSGFSDQLLFMVVRKILSSGNPIYKTSCVKSIGGYNVELSAAQDWDFHIRLVLFGARFHYIPGEFFIIRKTEGSVSSNWIKVYETACLHLPKLKDDIRSHALYSQEIGDYLASVYYLTLIHSERQDQRRFLRKELRFWSEGRRSFLTSNFKKGISFVLGWRVLEWLERSRVKKSA